MKNNRRGFSMVEVMTAMVIISVLAAGIFAATSFSKRMDVTAQQRLIAMSKVEERMNYLKEKGVVNLPTTGAPTGDPCPTFSHPACRSSVCICMEKELNGTMNGVLSTMVYDTDPADPNVKEVTVSFDWKDSLGADRSTSAATYMIRD